MHQSDAKITCNVGEYSTGDASGEQEQRSGGLLERGPIGHGFMLSKLLPLKILGERIKSARRG